MSTHRPGAPAPQSEPSRTTARPLTAAQICGITVFPLLGTGLTLAGMPVSDALTLLAGCGGIGAATIAAGGGRRLRTTLAAAVVRAAADTEVR
ncbi:hypothetical protein WN71_034320 [Streptomyces mangrovisoli]|uniref:Uncharacterized protein n=1 Tax=Streptomyces mangrovisoli TaxID=1428628 RepID=A0A1J4NMA3_9ACTN|nr:hypothetical protein WN71_034320 [Streptomyces mangrovisoli]